MTLLEMLDVLEAGCIILQQRSSELAAAFDQTRTDVTVDLPKRRRPAKRKRKATKRRSKSSKKPQLPLPLAAVETLPASEGDSKKEEAPKRGKRQALGMSFSKLRASIQARRGERRGDEEPASSENSS